MRIAGIIAEYNPFHNGHAWHVRQTREIAGCDYVIACMVGHFTQRGEPACLSKWMRARMALSCGVDAVFELPAMYAVRTADVFAASGVSVLGGLGVDVLSFGSETADMNLLQAFAAVHAQEPEALSSMIQDRLRQGMSHARARGDALSDYLATDKSVLNSPNTILAVEYVAAANRLFPNLELLPVERLGDYHSQDVSSPCASASAIRRAFSKHETDAAMRAIPEAARLFNEPDKIHEMDDMLLYRLRNMTLEDMAALPDMSEGLENRLYRLCRQYGERESLLNALKCKRYTMTRLSRMLTHALIGMTSEMTEKNKLPTYARLIGAKSKAKPLLKEIHRRSTLPIVSSPSTIVGDEVFELECRATDIWALLHDGAQLRSSGREFVEKFVSV